jgi:hypothetical protein
MQLFYLLPLHFISRWREIKQSVVKLNIQSFRQNDCNIYDDTMKSIVHVIFFLKQNHKNLDIHLNLNL